MENAGLDQKTLVYIKRSIFMKNCTGKRILVDK